MNEKEELNLTLPIILIGIIAIGVFVFFNVSDSGKNLLSINVPEVVKQNLTANVVHFTAPDRVTEGDTVKFSWKADVSEEALCVGKTEPEGSDGGWIGSKEVEGAQGVGPIEKNTTYFLDCTDGEKMVRDVEIVSVVKPKISFISNKLKVAYKESAELSWDAINVKECGLTVDGELVAEGTNGIYQTVKLEKTTSYNLSCMGGKDLVVETIEVVVEE